MVFVFVELDLIRRLLVLRNLIFMLLEVLFRNRTNVINCLVIVMFVILLIRRL